MNNRLRLTIDVVGMLCSATALAFVVQLAMQSADRLSANPELAADWLTICTLIGALLFYGYCLAALSASRWIFSHNTRENG